MWRKFSQNFLVNSFSDSPVSPRLHSLNKSNDNYPCNYLLVDSNQNQVIGHVTVSLERDQNGQKVAYVESLIIRQDYRKQGLGRFLMAELERILIRDQFKALTLKTIDQVGFYESIGFKLKSKVRSLLIGCRKNVKQDNQPNGTPNIEPIDDRPASGHRKSSNDSPSNEQKAAIPMPPPPPPPPPTNQPNHYFEYHLEKRIDLKFTATDCR